MFEKETNLGGASASFACFCLLKNRRFYLEGFIMQKIPVQNAIGQALCHDMTAILESGFKGIKFKRGHVITEADIPELLNIGKTHVYVWKPEADEVHEDDAAAELVKVLCGANLEYTGPAEGKFQISSATDGLFCVNSEALRHINSVDDYTVATRPGFCAVAKGEKLCGMRIVPLVTKRSNVDAAVKLAAENFPVLEVKSYKIKRVGAIITGSEIFTGKIKDAFEPILHKKVEYYGAKLERVTMCDDDLNMIKSAIFAYVDAGIELILLTGGMSVDPDDLTPTAIRQSGAAVVTQGVPMQPGNMLTIAKLGSVTLIGVPGASMHSPVTSLDVFLPRIMAGVEIKKSDIAKCGEGGFCMGCKICTYPLCYFGNIGH